MTPKKMFYLGGELIAEVYGDNDSRNVYPRGNFVVSSGDGKSYLTFEDTDERLEGVMYVFLDEDGTEIHDFRTGVTWLRGS